MLNYAVANVEHLHQDGRIEWKDHVNLDEIQAIGAATDREVVPAAQ